MTNLTILCFPLGERLHLPCSSSRLYPYRPSLGGSRLLNRCLHLTSYMAAKGGPPSSAAAPLGVAVSATSRGHVIDRNSQLV
jgi:hypothetical protein